MNRRLILIVCALIVPALAFGQSISTRSSGGGVVIGGSVGTGAYGHHGGRGGAGLPPLAGGIPPVGNVAPHPGFGNINHPGLGYAPNTPGIGYPLMPGVQPNPAAPRGTVGGQRPVYGGYGGYYGYYGPGYGYPTHTHYRGCGHAGWGAALAVPVPVPVPVYVGVGGYYYSSTSTVDTYPYAYPQTVQQVPAQQAPQVIIINNPPPQDYYANQAPAKAAPARTEQEPEPAPIHVTSGAPPAQKVTAPLTLLVLKDHTILAVNEYWREGDRVHYVTTYGVQASIRLEQLDLDFTKKLNEERNVKFALP